MICLARPDHQRQDVTRVFPAIYSKTDEVHFEGRRMNSIIAVPLYYAWRSDGLGQRFPRRQQQSHNTVIVHHLYGDVLPSAALIIGLQGDESLCHLGRSCQGRTVALGRFLVCPCRDVALGLYIVVLTLKHFADRSRRYDLSHDTASDRVGRRGCTAPYGGGSGLV